MNRYLWYKRETRKIFKLIAKNQSNKNHSRLALQTLEIMNDFIDGAIFELDKHRGKQCGWINCKIKASEHRKLYICKGCKTTHYCSRECQKISWNITKFKTVLFDRLPVATYGVAI